MLFPMLGRELFSLERLPNTHESEKSMKETERNLTSMQACGNTS